MANLGDPLKGLRFSVAGAGKVGSSLATWMVSKGAELGAAAAGRLSSAEALCAHLGGRPTTVLELDSAAHDLLLIAVSDANLESVAGTLAGRQQASVALHTSGRESAEILVALRDGGTAIGSLHPLMAFPKILADAGMARGVVFGIDGDAAALDLARRLVAAWHGVYAEIPASRRELYHLGATLAAGGVVTLLASAADLVRSLGLDDAVKAGYLKLAAGAVQRAAESSDIVSAITGPLARGDLRGFAHQVNSLRELDPDLADLVERLAQRTLTLRGKTGEGRLVTSDGQELIDS